MHKSVHALLKELEHRSGPIAAMGLTTKIPDEPLTGKLINLANTQTDLDRMSRALDSLAKAGLAPADAETNVRLLIKLNAFRVSLASGGIERINALGWTIRAHAPRPVTMAINTQDPYRLAQENRYYPFKTAGQFTRHAPFLLVFPYAAQFNTWLCVNFAGSTDVALRAMARRAFVQLSTDAAPLRNYDAQTSPGTSVADASKLISGLLFLNLQEDGGWLFLNPRATHPLTRYDIEQIFDFRIPSGLAIDDFAHDDY
jgi:hypothetical protein